MNAPGTDWILSEEGNRLYNRLRRFLSRPQEVGYLFMTATDDRLIPNINQKLMQEVPGLGIFFWQESDQPFVQQLLDFAATHSAIVVANLSGIARRQPTFLQSLNFAREQLNGLEKPIGFWLTPATLKQVANKAADLYSQRRYTVLAFEDELPQETLPKISQSFVHEETEEIQAQIDLLEEQLKTALTTNRPRAEVAQAIALPLAQAYAEDGQGSKALELLSDYNESLNKENPDNLFEIATVHEKAFDYEWAITYFKAAAQKYNHSRDKAVSYEKLGGIYQTQGELAKALDYFEKEVVLFEELHQANPRQDTIKRGLAVSYEKLGDIYQTQGELAKALDYFEKEVVLFEELHQANPRLETLKRDLATPYERLGSIYQVQGELAKALDYFEKCSQLFEELHQANPRSETSKRGLAISYARLGDIYQKQGELTKALNYFEKDLNLSKELYQANPRSVMISNDLGVSYWKLGNLFRETNKPTEAKLYFQKAESIWSALYTQVNLTEYKANLAEVRRDLAGLT